MFIAALAFSACSDDDDKDHVKVPEALTQALKPNILPPETWIGNRKVLIMWQIAW